MKLYHIAVDAHDTLLLARFWAAVLGYDILKVDDDGEVLIGAGERTYPGIVFLPVPESKTTKNRLHLDMTPEPHVDHAAEVARIVALGARRVDVGQGEDAPWAVRADPEGNEFCVLQPKRSLLG
jgi:hypothetical protein